MFKDISIFQLVLAGVSLLLAAGGLMAFITFSSSSENTVPLTLWTDVPAPDLWQYVGDEDAVGMTITVRQFPPDNFVNKVIDALSLGQVPDIVVTSTVNQRRLGDRLRAISYDSLPKNQFQTNYITGANQAFSTSNDIGYTGIPLAVDPLVLYSNQGILNENGIVSPPEYWDEVSSLTNQFAQRSGFNIIQSVIPLGTGSNIANGQEILFSLLGQVNKYPTRYENGVLITDLRDQEAVQIVNYYTDFANVNTGVYNWNTSFASARQAFTTGDTFFYIDNASQATGIQSENPNQLLAISELPQIRGNAKYVYADIYGAYFPTNAITTSAAVSAMIRLITDANFNYYLNQNGLVSASRSQIDTASSDQLINIAANSALVSGTSLVSDKARSRAEFSELVDNILFRGRDTELAVSDYANRLLEL